MNTKKWLALLLSAALALGLLAGCAAAPETETAETVETTAAPETEADQTPETETGTEEDAGADAQFQAVMDRLQRAWETYEPGTPVCTIDGQEVRWSEYYGFLSDELMTLVFYYLGDIPEDFGAEATEDRTIAELLQESALMKAKLYAVAHSRALSEGVELSEEAEQGIQAQWDEMAEQAGGEEELLSSLAESYMDRDTAFLILRGNEEISALMEHFYGLEGEKLPEEDALAWAEEGGYARVKHILYFFYDDDGQPLDEDGMAEQRARAEATLSELQGLLGDKEALEARFDEIMAADTGDAGGLSSFPEGYTFTSGTMYAEFEDVAFALEEYALSEIVASQAGYHILLRLPLDPDGLTMDQNANTGGYLTLRQDAANDLFNRMLIDWINAAEVEWAPGFEELDLNALFAAEPAE